jgi:hypothetical protein
MWDLGPQINIFNLNFPAYEEPFRRLTVCMSLCLKPLTRCFIISLSSEQSETRQTSRTGFLDFEFEVFTEVRMKYSILWVVMKRSHVERCDCYLWGGGGDTQKINFYETLTLSHQTTWHYVSEDRNIPSLFFFNITLQISVSTQQICIKQEFLYYILMILPIFCIIKFVINL